MILPDFHIVKRIEEDDLIVEDIDPSQIQPASVDLKLGNEFVEFDKPHNHGHIDPSDDNAEYYGRHKEVDDAYYLGPKEFVLGITLENVNIPPDLVGLIHGRSSWARLAVAPHTEAGLLDPGYSGNPTLEIFNFGTMPVKLEPGTRFCQMMLLRMVQPPKESYDGKYQGQTGVSPSKLHEEANED